MSTNVYMTSWSERVIPPSWAERNVIALRRLLASTMKALLMLMLVGSILIVLAPAASADSGDCPNYPTADVQVVACGDGEGNSCVVAYVEGNPAFACAPTGVRA